MVKQVKRLPDGIYQMINCASYLGLVYIGSMDQISRKSGKYLGVQNSEKFWNIIFSVYLQRSSRSWSNRRSKEGISHRRRKWNPRKRRKVRKAARLLSTLLYHHPKKTHRKRLIAKWLSTLHQVLFNQLSSNLQLNPPKLHLHHSSQWYRRAQPRHPSNNRQDRVSLQCYSANLRKVVRHRNF